MNDAAVEAVKTAVYIQTGAANTVGQVQSYVTNRAKLIVSNLGLAPVVYPLVFVQHTVVTKQFSFKIGKETITLHPDSIQLEIPF